MDTTAMYKKGAASFEESKPAGQILILYEDFSAYTHTVEVCRHLMERFASVLDFDVKCWNFIELADPNCARHAAKTAGGADIVLLAARTPRLPMELERWLDYFFITRFRPDGVFALVLNTTICPRAAQEKLVLRLEQSSVRLGMSFISLLPDDDVSVINLQPQTASLQMGRLIR